MGAFVTAEILGGHYSVKAILDIFAGNCRTSVPSTELILSSPSVVGGRIVYGVVNRRIVYENNAKILKRDLSQPEVHLLWGERAQWCRKTFIKAVSHLLQNLTKFKAGGQTRHFRVPPIVSYELEDSKMSRDAKRFLGFGSQT